MGRQRDVATGWCATSMSAEQSQFRGELLAQIKGAHVGESLTEKSFELVFAAVRKFDEHLDYQVTLVDGGITLRIAPPEETLGWKR